MSTYSKHLYLFEMLVKKKKYFQVQCIERVSFILQMECVNNLSPYQNNKSTPPQNYVSKLFNQP